MECKSIQLLHPYFIVKSTHWTASNMFHMKLYVLFFIYLFIYFLQWHALIICAKKLTTYIRVSECCMYIYIYTYKYISWLFWSLLDTLNKLFNTLSNSLVVQLPKSCAWSMILSIFVEDIKKNRLVLNHISYCEQIAILNLFKINVFLYGIMFFLCLLCMHI